MCTNSISHLRSSPAIDIAESPQPASGSSAFAASKAAKPSFARHASHSPTSDASFKAGKASSPIFARRAARSTSLSHSGSPASPRYSAIARAYSQTVEGQQAIRQLVAKEFVLEKHMAAIETASRLGNFAVSFRLAGAATLNRLAAGAPAKGHDIADKTIKEKSIRDNYPADKADAILDRLDKAGLLGYVGKWDKETKELIGIYMGSAHNLGDLVKGGVYPIDLNNLEHSLQALKQQDRWETLPFTGDYDLHEIISFTGRAAMMPSESFDEKRAIASLNWHIAAADTLREGKSIEYDVVRHGPQGSYPAFALQHKEKMIYSVAKPDFPVAVVREGKWTIINNKEEHAAFYKDNGVNMKVTWDDPADPTQRRSSLFLQRLPDGSAKFSRRSSN